LTSLRTVWLSEQLLESQAAFRTTFSVTGDYLKAGTSFLKVFGFINDFKEASRNLIFDFLHRKAAKYCKNYQR
jgi:hypothetical protein